MPTLTIQLPGLPPVSHVLKDETITIGRLKGNTIVIEDSSISLMHAKITRKDSDFYVKDLNSTNGTMVNGQPIGEARLRDQDRVRFADITTQFLADGPAAAMGSPAPIASAATPAPVSAALISPKPALLPSPHGVPALAGSAPSPAPRPTQSRTRTLAIAAGILVVVLPGLGMLGWKFLPTNTEKAPSAQAVPKPQKSSNPEVASQISAAKPVLEARPVPDSNEPASLPAINIPEMLLALKSNDVAERRQAASALHGAGGDAKEAIPGLRQALKDPDAEVQMWAALALVNTQTYDQAIIPILIRALKNHNAVLRQVACLSLGVIPYEGSDKDSVIPSLATAAAKDADEDVRKAAASALSIVAPDAPESAAVK